MMRFVHAAVGAALLASVVAPAPNAWAAEDDRARYTACMAKARKSPKAAFDMATEWEGNGGGYPARHCALAALVESGHFYEAAQGLEKLADLVHAEAPLKADLLAQAAAAWIGADDFNRARAVADTALGLVPQAKDVEVRNILFQRARASAGLGAYGDAVKDLSRVIAVDPANAQALALRGAAHRQLDALDLAMDDLNRALTIDATQQDALLERGIVKRLKGDKAGARADWRALIEAHPDSEATKEAEINLHMLDSGVE